MITNRANGVIDDLMEGWGDVVDRQEMRWNETLGQSSSVYPVADRNDRLHGQNRPIFETEFELAAIRGAARLVHDTSPHAQTITGNLLNFIDGTGFQYKCQPKAPADDDLAKAVQRIVDEFLDRNEWQSAHGCREEEIVTRAVRDGETPLALFDRDGDGYATARFIEPDQITEPGNVGDVEEWIASTYGYCPDSNWRFGVHTTLGDVEDVHGYFVQYSHDQTDWDYFPIDQMTFIKLNVDRNVSRGLSSFFSVQEYLTSTGKLERNVVKGAAILSAILGIRQHAASTSKSNVESLIAASRYRHYNQSTPDGVRNRNVARLTPGSWLDVSNGLEYKPPPLATQGVASAFVEIDQATLRTVGLPWQMPEYMISADSSNANFASAMVAEAPVVKRFEREQALFGGDFRKICWNVVKMAHTGGRLRQFDLAFEEIRRLVSIIVTGPRVAARDANIETNQHKILFDNGQLSARGWSEKEGIDYDLEQERGAKVQSQTLPTAGVPAAGVDVGGRPPLSESERCEQAANLLWEAYP